MVFRRSKPTITFEEDKNGLSSLLWMLIGAAITVCVGFYAYQQSYFDFDETAVVPSKPIKSKVADQGMENTAVDNTSYEFYDILPDETIPVTIESDKTEEAEQTAEEIAKQTKSFRPDVIVAQAKEKKDTSAKREEEQVAATAKKEVTTNTDSKSEKTKAAATSNLNASQNTVNENKTKAEAQTKQKTASNSANVQAAVTTKAENNAKGTDAVLVKSADDIAKLGEQIQKELTGTSNNATNNNAKNSANSNKVIAKAEPVKVKAPPKPKKSYILQISSHTTADEADIRRGQILMTGVDVRVVKSPSGIYRVVSHIMLSPKEVLAVKNKLEKSGIDSVVVEQRR